MILILILALSLSDLPSHPIAIEVCFSALLGICYIWQQTGTQTADGRIGWYSGNRSLFVSSFMYVEITMIEASSNTIILLKSKTLFYTYLFVF